MNGIKIIMILTSILMCLGGMMLPIVGIIGYINAEEGIVEVDCYDRWGHKIIEGAVCEEDLGHTARMRLSVMLVVAVACFVIAFLFFNLYQLEMYWWGEKNE